jgi:acetyl esterase/lipase
VKDSAQAVAWTLRSLRELGGDPQRVFVMGHSAGAYNASMVALDPRWLREPALRRMRCAAGSDWPDPMTSCPSKTRM